MTNPSPNTTVKRLPEKQERDPAVLAAILASGSVAHVAAIREGWPHVLPVAYAPWRDGIVLHGSRASRLFRQLAAGSPTCATITLLDGVVLARSAFESSMEYRCAMLFGTAQGLTGSDKAHAFRDLTDHLLPGRWDHIRHPSSQEDKATLLLYLVPSAWSVKTSAGFADDTAEDLIERAEVWSGRIPLAIQASQPVPDATTVASGVSVPAHVSDMFHHRS